MATTTSAITESTALLSGRRDSFSTYSINITHHNHNETAATSGIVGGGGATEANALAEASLEDGLKAPEEDATTVWAETKLLGRYSVSLIITYLLQYSFMLVAMLVIGHLGTRELGAVSLASMTANITGLAVYEGLATSLDTLCAQAYGSGKPLLVGLHLQRMIIFLLLVTVPIAALWLTSPLYLPYLVPEKEVAVLAGRGLRIWLIGAPGYAIFEAGKRFTQAQGIFSASFYVLLVCAPINALLCYTLVYRLELGFEGAILGLSITNLLMPCCLFAYVVFVSPSALKCWPGFSRQVFKNWGPMLKLSVPGVLMVESEWLAFDILTFLASHISTPTLAAQSVLMTIGVLLYHFPFPVAIAASTRIGNLIGSGALKATKIALKTYVVVFGIIGLTNMILLISLRKVLPRAFTADPVVIEIVADVMPIVAAFQLFDSTTALGNAVLRGLGRQAIGGYANLGAYYVIALPLALFLSFGPPNLRLWGLWIGPAIGLALITVLEGVYIWTCNWDKIVEDARAREE